MEDESLEELLEEQVVLRENVKTFRALYDQEKQRCDSLEAKLQRGEATMVSAMHLMADDMTRQIEELRRDNERLRRENATLRGVPYWQDDVPPQEPMQDGETVEVPQGDVPGLFPPYDAHLETRGQFDKPEAETAADVTSPEHIQAAATAIAGCFDMDFIELGEPIPYHSRDSSQNASPTSEEGAYGTSKNVEFPRLEGWLMREHGQWLMKRWIRGYWVLRDHILHGYWDCSLEDEFVHVALDGCQVQSVKGQPTILNIRLPTPTGARQFQLKAEKESDAYVWVAVLMQSNKVRERRTETTKTPTRSKQPIVTDEADDYEL